MAGGERPNGHERQDPLANTKRIVDLVFRLPVNPSRSEQVLDAVGTVYADLRVLDERRRLDRQLASGLSTQDVETAIANIHEAASLRPADENATEQRMLVLAGLERIRQATLFNENVGQQAQNGIAIVQIGVTSKHVEAVITDVLEAKQFVEQSQLASSSADDQETIKNQNGPYRDESLSEPVQDIVDVSTPIQSQQPAEDILDRVHTDRLESKIDHPPLLNIPFVSGRRAFLSAAGLLVTSLVFGSLVDPDNNIKKTDEEKKAEDEAYIREHSLTDQSTIQDKNGWFVAYPSLEEGEVFEDIFKGGFQQTFYWYGANTHPIPLYVAQGENNPVQRNKINDMRLSVSTSEFRQPLSIIQIDHGSCVPRWQNRNSNFSNWDKCSNAVVSGRKNPESPELRPYPNVVQFTHKSTRETHYLAITIAPWVNTNISPGDWGFMNEIIYMKRVKKN